MKKVWIISVLYSSIITCLITWFCYKAFPLFSYAVW